MPKQIYIDSRFRVAAGGSNSDAEFSVELPYPIRVKGRAFVDCFVCSNSFFSIRVGENDRIHIGEGTTGAATIQYRIPTIAHGQYNVVSLKAALQTALQTGKTITANYVVDYDDVTGRLKMGLDGTGNEAFTIFPENILKDEPFSWNGFQSNPALLIDPKLLRDSGGVTGFNGPNLFVGDAANDAIAGEAVNIQPYGQLFLRSSLGSGYDAIGADGSSDIIRRVLVQVGLNDTIVDQHSLPHDSVSVHDMEIASMSFRLTDVHSRTVNTQGHPVSFSILFIED